MLVVKFGNLFVNITQYTSIPMTKQVDKSQVAQLPENHGESESNSAPKLWQRKPPKRYCCWRKKNPTCLHQQCEGYHVYHAVKSWHSFISCPEFPYLSSDDWTASWFLRRVPVTQDWWMQPKIRCFWDPTKRGRVGGGTNKNMWNKSRIFDPIWRIFFKWVGSTTK